MKQINISLAFDMRAPDWGAPRAALYKAAVEMAAFGDRIGVSGINLMEHHGSEDGYLPQPFTLASAMAAVTSQIQFSLGAVILPLHDPVMVAEQIAVLDLISQGRIRVIFGAGYVPSEFAMFQTSTRDRAKRLDAGIEIILRANIEFNKPHRDANTFTLISGGPGEGKSTTINNLAFTCAKGGYNVLVVDADLRRATQHKLFGVSNELGLTDYLIGRAEIDEIVKTTNDVTVSASWTRKLPLVGNASLLLEFDASATR